MPVKDSKLNKTSLILDKIKSISMSSFTNLMEFSIIVKEYSINPFWRSEVIIGPLSLKEDNFFERELIKWFIPKPETVEQ